jgi:T5SS/PEP-CTERM-associated repeat protein
MATYIWFAAGSGDFNVASNWTLDGVNPAPTAPGPADTAYFTIPVTATLSGNGNVNLIQFTNPNANWTVTGQLANLFGIDLDGTVTLAAGASIASDGLGIGTTDSSGTLVVGPDAHYYGTYPAQHPPPSSEYYVFNVGDFSGATGTAIVEGPGALVDTGANGASVGLNPNSTGSLQILAGGKAEFATSDPPDLASLSVGRWGTGTVTVDGAGSQLVLSGYLLAGRSGTGTVTLTNGASLTETAVGTGFASNFGVGGGNPFLTGGTGTLNVLPGSTATFGDSLGFGKDGATGVGLVSDATLSVGGLIRVGTGTTAPGGKGTLTIEDGGVVRDTAAANTSTAYVLLGATAGTTGTVSVDGWGSRLDAGANAIDVGAIGTGTLTASDHGLITSTGLSVGDHGNGTLNLTSGAAAIDTSPSGTGAALTVGAQAGGTGSISVSGHGSTLIAVGEAVLGGTDTGSGITAGGTGNISVSQGGLLGTGNMTIESGSSLGIDGSGAALIAGNLSDGGGITTSGLLAVTGTVSGAGSVTLDGGLANLGSLDGTNVSFGGAPAELRIQALSGASSVSDMQAGDVVDLVGQHGVRLNDDTVTTKSGMLFLSPAPAGDSYKLVTTQHGTAVLLVATSAYGMSDADTANTGQFFGSDDDLRGQFGFANTIENLGLTLSTSTNSFSASHGTAAYTDAAAGIGDTFAGVDLAAAYRPHAVQPG